MIKSLKTNEKALMEVKEKSLRKLMAYLSVKYHLEGTFIQSVSRIAYCAFENLIPRYTNVLPLYLTYNTITHASSNLIDPSLTMNHGLMHHYSMDVSL